MLYLLKYTLCKYYIQLKDERELLTRMNLTILNGWDKFALIKLNQGSSELVSYFDLVLDKEVSRCCHLVINKFSC